MEEKNMRELSNEEMKQVSSGFAVPGSTSEPDDPIDLPVHEPVPILIFSTTKK